MLLAHTLLASCAFAADVGGAASGSQGYATGVVSPPPAAANMAEPGGPNVAAGTIPPLPYLTVNDLAGNTVLRLALAADQDDPEAQIREVWERHGEIGERLRAAVPGAGPASYEDFRLVALPMADALLLQPTDNGPQATLWRVVFPDAREYDLRTLAHIMQGVSAVEKDVEKFVRERNNWALLADVEEHHPLGARRKVLREYVSRVPGPFLRRHDAREIFAAAHITKSAQGLGYALTNVRSEAEARALLALGDQSGATYDLMGVGIVG